MLTNETLRTLCIPSRRKRLMWILFFISVVLIVLIIIIPTTIILTKESTTINTQTKAPLCYIETNKNPRWSQNGTTVAGGNECGDDLNQLDLAFDIYVDDNQTLYIADYLNLRIVEWNNGTPIGKVIVNRDKLWDLTEELYYYPTHVIVDKENDSLIFCTTSGKVIRWPRRNGGVEIIFSNVPCHGLTMDNDKYLYMSNSLLHEVRRWQVGNTYGKLIAGGNGPGDCLNQLAYPTCIFVDQDQSVYILDTSNHRVMKWVKDATEGIIVAGGYGEGNSLKQFSYPYGLSVDKFGNVYVADTLNNRVMHWSKDGTQVCMVVGGNGKGNYTDQLNRPYALSFDQQDNLYVADRLNYRVQKFNINSKNTEN